MVDPDIAGPRERGDEGHIRFPVVFRGPNDNTGAGGLAYIALVPVLTVALFGFVGAILHALLTWFGVDAELAGNLLAAVLLPLTFVLVAGFAIKDFRRRAGGKIEVFEDCIVVSSAFHEHRLSSEEIANVRIFPEGSRDACRLELTNGRRLHLLSEIVTFQELQPFFEVMMLDGLVRRMLLELKDGGTVELNESCIRAFVRWLWGIGGFGIGLLFFYLVPFLPWMPGVKSSVRRIRRGWRGMMGGFSITEESVNAAGIIPSVPVDLSELNDVVPDEIGLTLRFAGGVELKASLFARNYWVVLFWLSGRFSQQPLDSPGTN